VTVVVSDTSPLNYLILCGAIDVLPALFHKVVIPPASMISLLARPRQSADSAWSEHSECWRERRQ
jgi:predicted nucleic acid-binding protein